MGRRLCSCQHAERIHWYVLGVLPGHTGRSLRSNGYRFSAVTAHRYEAAGEERLYVQRGIAATAVRPERECAG